MELLLLLELVTAGGDVGDCVIDVGEDVGCCCCWS